jgi:hypothetical protein
MVLASGLTIGAGGGLPYIGVIDVLPDRDWFLSYYGSSKIRVSHDHDVFYHALGESIHNARTADILLLGSSRVLFGFDWRGIERFASEYGLRIFNMGFPSEVSGDFSLSVIRKHDLRPKIVIIHLTHGGRLAFLDHRQTHHAEETISQGRLKRTKAVFSSNVRWRVANLFDILLPGGFSTWNPMGWDVPVIYRSRRNGCYLHDGDMLKRFFAPLPAGHSWQILDPKPASPLTDQEIDATLQLKQEMAARGVRIVLCYLPDLHTSPGSTGELAQRVDVPFIYVDPIDLSWCEFWSGGHLDHNGAVTFTERFLRELEKCEPFRELIAQH